ncbi:MAG: TetR/AcrR family transcriptional regulator [Sphingobacteriaceae bacterium]
MEPRDRILKGAADLFFKAGIKSITMNDIAGYLGMSKKTIYQYFSDKGAIVHEIAENHIQRDELAICSLVKTSDSVMNQIVNILKCSEEIMGSVNPVIFFDLQKYHPKTWALFEAFKANVVIKNLEVLLATGIQEGYIRPEIDVRVLSRLRVNEVTMGFDQGIFPSKDFNNGHVQRILMEHFIYGLCTTKGYESIQNYNLTAKTG